MWGFYGWLWLILLFVGGIYAILELITRKSQDGRLLLGTISPLQGFTGATLMIMSVLNLLWHGFGHYDKSAQLMLFPNLPYPPTEIKNWIEVLQYYREDLKTILFSEIVFIIVIITGILLGLLGTLRLLHTFRILREPQIENLVNKLLFLKALLGIIAIVSGILLVIFGTIRPFL
ncbi:MAG: hypothetical protein EHM28_03470 [Spirochaetaceae bacterium]|nr:MAG: hypothetical protein EHM28_03470 [Spirochaetaceae bacterium]